MLVFHKENLVLLAVPKTGTSALSAALAPRASIVLRDPPRLKHMPVQRYQRFLAPLLAQGTGQPPELMAVVRNPVDWLGSWYRYRHRDALAGKPNSTRGVSFDEFVLEHLKDAPAPFAEVGSQAQFLNAVDAPAPVQHLFRYEAQPLILAFLAERLGRAVDLKPVNVSPDLPLALSDNTRAALHTARAADFALWQSARH